MISERSRNPVDGSLESGPEGKPQCFVSGVLHAAARPQWFTGGVGQLEVSIHRLKMKKNNFCKPSLYCNIQSRTQKRGICSNWKQVKYKSITMYIKKDCSINIYPLFFFYNPLLV